MIAQNFIFFITRDCRAPLDGSINLPECVIVDNWNGYSME